MRIPYCRSAFQLPLQGGICLANHHTIADTPKFSLADNGIIHRVIRLDALAPKSLRLCCDCLLQEVHPWLDLSSLTFSIHFLREWSSMTESGMTEDPTVSGFTRHRMGVFIKPAIVPHFPGSQR